MYPSTEQSISLKQLLGIVKKAIQESFEFQIWVRAEIIKLNYYPSSGHAYPELAEKESEKIVARANAVIWREDFYRIQQKFKAVTGELLRDGLQILFLCQVKFHEYYGLQLQISDIDPSFTLGRQALLKQQTIERLKKEGLFNLNKQLPFPLLPQRFAIISIATSRGFNDLMTILKEHGAKYNWSYKLFPAILEGEKAVQTIVFRLQEIAKQKNQFDVILIIRGGGDETGLDAYDNYELAKAIAMSPLPVITGIGHSTNETVAEMVSAINKITPTDVAYFFIDIFKRQEQWLMDVKNEIYSQTLLLLGSWMDDVYMKRQRISNLGLQKNKQLIQQLHELKIMLQKKFNSVWNDNKSVLFRYRENVKNNLLKILYAYQQKNSFFRVKLIALSTLNLQHKIFFIRQNREHLKQLISHQIKIQKVELEKNRKNIELLNPVKILERGYTFTKSKQKLIKSINEVEIQEEITTFFKDGRIVSIIKNKAPYE